MAYHDTLQVLDFDSVCGYTSDAKRTKRLKGIKPLPSPCNGCACQFACAGARQANGVPNSNRAMACPSYEAWLGSNSQKPKLTTKSRLPSRGLFDRLFG